MNTTYQITVELTEEPELTKINEASLDGKEYYPVKFVARSGNEKAPYICRRQDLSRASLREYKYVRSSEKHYSIIYQGQKYLLTPAPLGTD